MVRFRCPHCRKVLKAAAQLAGKAAKCGKCGERLVVPKSGAVSEDEILDILGRPQAAVDASKASADASPIGPGVELPGSDPASEEEDEARGEESPPESPPDTACATSSGGDGFDPEAEGISAGVLWFAWFALNAVPVGVESGALRVLVADVGPLDIQYKSEALELAFRCPIKASVARMEEVDQTSERQRRAKAAEPSQGSEETRGETEYVLDPELTDPLTKPVTHVLHMVVAAAANDHASQLLFLPTMHKVHLWCIDSKMCWEMVSAPLSLGKAITAYLKHDVWKDGKIRFAFRDEILFVEPGFRRTQYGEAAALYFPKNRDAPEEPKAAQDGQAAPLLQGDVPQKEGVPASSHERFCPHCGIALAMDARVCGRCADEDKYVRRGTPVHQAWRSATCTECGMCLGSRGTVVCPYCKFDHALDSPRVEPTVKPRFSMPFAAARWPAEDKSGDDASEHP